MIVTVDVPDDQMQMLVKDAFLRALQEAVKVAAKKAVEARTEIVQQAVDKYVERHMSADKFAEIVQQMARVAVQERLDEYGN